MATEVDISNLALAHLGDAAEVVNISPPDGSAQAAHCARFYPISRDALLEQHSWPFATRRESMALHSEAAPNGWLYRYVLPNNCLKVLAVFDPGVEDENDEEPFVLEVGDDGVQTLICDVELAVCKFILKLTDTSKFSPMFITSLSYLLASYLAGPISKSADKKEEMLKAFEREAMKATTSSANSSKSAFRQRYVPGSIGVRRS